MSNRYDNIKRDFPKVLEKHMGIVSSACAATNISRESYYRWRKEDEQFAIACDEASEYTGDFVENQLLSLIKDKDTSAIIFYCKTKLRNRGYSERIDLKHSGDRQDPIMHDVTHTMDDSDKAILDRYYQKRMKSEGAIVESTSCSS